MGDPQMQALEPLLGDWTVEGSLAPGMGVSPLDFAQRFTGRIDGDVIDGRWEIARDGDWGLDFELRSTRRS